LRGWKEGSGEDLSRYRVGGGEAIAVQIFKQNEANTVRVVELTLAPSRNSPGVIPV
jgi:multidrug efflux pump subunit AcrB